MNHQNDPKKAGQNMFLSSIAGLANTIAAVATFFGTPTLHSKTISTVQGFTTSQYGYGFEDITSLTWFAVCGCLVFFISRASISTALVTGGLALAVRFF